MRPVYRVVGTLSHIESGDNPRFAEAKEQGDMAHWAMVMVIRVWLLVVVLGLLLG